MGIKSFFVRNLPCLLLLLTYVILLITGAYDGDLGDYTLQIDSLLNGKGINNNGGLIHRYPPLTALVSSCFIKGFGLLGASQKVSVLSSNILFSCLILLSSIQILNLLYLHRLNSILSAIIIFNPFVLSFNIRGVNSELIYIALSLCAVYFSVKYIKRNKNILYLIITGFFIGLALLTRTQGLILLVSIIALLTYQLKAKAFVPMLVIFATSLLVISPWQYLIFTHSSPSGDIPFISSGAKPSFRDGLTFNHKPHRSKIKLPRAVEDISNDFFITFYDTTKIRVCEDLEVSPYKFVKDYVIERPDVGIALFWFKAKRSWYGTDSQNGKIEFINKVLVSIILLLLLISIVILSTVQKWNIGFIFFVTLYTLGVWCMSILALSILRYQVILFPFYFILMIVAFTSTFLPDREVENSST